MSRRGGKLPRSPNPRLRALPPDKFGLAHGVKELGPVQVDQHDPELGAITVRSRAGWRWRWLVAAVGLLAQALTVGHGSGKEPSTALRIAVCGQAHVPRAGDIISANTTR